ncbi:hypothetical protein B0O99DRAFT_633314 [Bisporella sp. PMI_857]|nr:hypothetical protein B0O99DRAFT_633314 [Bisporella sp. PMI_857]
MPCSSARWKLSFWRFASRVRQIASLQSAIHGWSAPEAMPKEEIASWFLSSGQPVTTSAFQPYF